MPKRKREDEAGSYRRKCARPSPRNADAAIQKAKQLLLPALKLGKAFERQKLSRRQKTAHKDQDRGNAHRINDEIEAIKKLDLTKISEIHIHKAILKQKRLRESSLLPAYVQENARMEMDQATANVCARIYKSAPVTKAMKEAMDDVRVALGADSDANTASTGNTKDVTKATESRDDPKGPKKEGEPLDHDHDMPNAKPDDESTNGDGDEINYDEYADRLASDSDEASIDLEALKATHKPTRDLSVSMSPSPSGSSFGPFDDEHDAADDKPAHNTDNQENTKPTPSKPQPTSSTFLPTLSGYFSGDSDASEAEDLPELTTKRKNRRGQRARQQIWEAKYGQKAKHLQKEDGRGSRDAGWDPKRGATSGTGANSVGVARPRGDRGVPFKPREKVAPRERARPARADVGAKPMHPSWEAARKAKEKNGGAGAGAFAGKKVVFD